MSQSHSFLKNEFKPNLKRRWCTLPEHSAAFAAAMEDVPEVYSRPYDENYPVVCVDEKPIQFLPVFARDFVVRRMALNMKTTNISVTMRRTFFSLQNL